MLNARAEGSRGGVAVEEEDNGVRGERWGYVLGWVGGDTWEGFVVFVGKDEPGTDGFVVGSLDFKVYRSIGWKWTRCGVL